jgi:hypothetical protein
VSHPVAHLAKRWETTNLNRPSPFPLRLSGSLLQSEAGRRAARLGVCIEIASGARLHCRDVAISVAAQADNLHSVPDFFAVIAAISLLFRGEAGTARIRAFLWIRRKTPHNPPLPVRPAPIRSWLTKNDAGIDERIVAQICAHMRAKSNRIILGFRIFNKPLGRLFQLSGSQFSLKLGAE